MPAMSSRLDPSVAARAHFNELQQYLATYLAKSPATSRTTARQKLASLTVHQFEELTVDVCDEIARRKTGTTKNEVSHLPPGDEFHSKRNQARQKLATLPTARFQDLLSDIYFELSRRYLELREDLPFGRNEVGVVPTGPVVGPSHDTIVKDWNAGGLRQRVKLL